MIQQLQPTPNKSRHGARPLVGWGARLHQGWAQTWRSHGEDVQRGEPPGIGMRDPRGLIEPSHNSKQLMERGVVNGTA